MKNFLLTYGLKDSFLEYHFAKEMEKTNFKELKRYFKKLKRLPDNYNEKKFKEENDFFTERYRKCGYTEGDLLSVVGAHREMWEYWYISYAFNKVMYVIIYYLVRFLTHESCSSLLKEEVNLPDLKEFIGDKPVSDYKLIMEMLDILLDEYRRVKGKSDPFFTEMVRYARTMQIKMPAFMRKYTTLEENRRAQCDAFSEYGIFLQKNHICAEELSNLERWYRMADQGWGSHRQ